MHTAGEKKKGQCAIFFRKTTSTYPQLPSKPRNTETLIEDLSPLFIMEKEQGSGILCRVLDEREEVVVDRERNVCDPIFSVGSV